MSRPPCPGCGLSLPTDVDTLASWVREPCCNPACEGQWGYGCWHCHGCEPSADSVWRAAKTALSAWARSLPGVSQPAAREWTFAYLIEWVGGIPENGPIACLIWALLPERLDAWHERISPRSAFQAVIAGRRHRAPRLDWAGGEGMQEALAVWLDRRQAEGDPLGTWAAQCLAGHDLDSLFGWEPAAIWALRRRTLGRPT